MTAEPNEGDQQDHDGGVDGMEDGNRTYKVGQDQLGMLDLCMLVQTVETDQLPSSWKQAIHIPQWTEAMRDEKAELEEKGALKLVPRPRDAKTLPGLWRFKVKKDENGTVVRHKARWCADGSRESFKRPPEAKYSPVAEMSTIRTVFAIAASKGQTILQADFPNAYLNADLKEQIYVVQPKGLEEPGREDYVCLLQKALYGTSISGKMWHETLKATVKGLGYQQSKIDHCLFFRDKAGCKELLTIYVDDVLVTSSGGIGRTEDQLNELCRIHDIKKLGIATFILGMGVRQREGKTELEQQAYTAGILEETDYLSAKPRSTPWDSHFSGNDEPLEGHKLRYTGE